MEKGLQGDRTPPGTGFSLSLWFSSSGAQALWRFTKMMTVTWSVPVVQWQVTYLSQMLYLETTSD